MGDEIELISDGEGLAVIGPPGAVERFLDTERLPARALPLAKVTALAEAGASITETASTAAAESGRWVKLTAESAEKVSRFGLQQTDTPGVRHAMIGTPGKIQEWIQVEDPGSLVSMVTNPAVLSGAAGIMAQLAMQQTMAEITDYLARIDEKLDDVIRTQTNQVLARMDAVALAVREAETIRDTVGRVSDVTWSKIQSSSGAVLETQAFAIRQLSDLADEVNDGARVDELVKVARQAEHDVQKWLAVLARCFQLHDAIAVLELDRVLDTSPHELDQHRLGLNAARQERLGLISTVTAALLDGMSIAAETANAKVLLNPIQSPAVISASNTVSTDVHELRLLLEIESGKQTAESRRWSEAAGEQWGKVRDVSSQGVDAVRSNALGDKALGVGAAGVGSAKSIGSGAIGKAKSMTGKLGAKRLSPRRDKAKRDPETDAAGEPAQTSEWTGREGEIDDG